MPLAFRRLTVSTHSRLKAAGSNAGCFIAFSNVSTHSRLKAAGSLINLLKPPIMFQHTAA